MHAVSTNLDRLLPKSFACGVTAAAVRGGKGAPARGLTEHDDLFAGRPIIIEGYADGGVSSDQLQLSRSRAMAVRQYVQDRL